MNFLIDILERSFRKKSWHGTNLLGSIRGLTPQEASWRPSKERHNIWEQIVHTAYWKYSAWRRLAGFKKATFPLKGSDWFPRPAEMDVSALKEDVRLLKEQHEQLIEAVTAFPEGNLNEVPQGSSVTFGELITGVAAHDVYHAGQIQLLKRLSKESLSG